MAFFWSAPTAPGARGVISTSKGVRRAVSGLGAQKQAGVVRQRAGEGARRNFADASQIKPVLYRYMHLSALSNRVRDASLISNTGEGRWHNPRVANPPWEPQQMFC